MTKNYLHNLVRRKLQLSWQACMVLFLFTSFGLGSMKAQVNQYLFSQSTGSYTSIGGGTVLGTATSNSGAASLYNVSYPVTLPFGFNFNNQNYTDLTVSSNGYITFGTGVATGSAPISSTIAYDGAISAWGRLINTVFDVGGKTGNISWTVEGSAPNRTAVIQWENFRPSYSTSATSAYIFSFQIRLAETSNIISTVYSAGSILVGTGAFSSTNAQIGLRGATNADFNNRYNPSTSSFNSSEPGVLATNGQSYNTLVDPPGMPADGLMYTWTPSTCFGPTSLSVANITTNSATLSWMAPASPPANGYEIYYDVNNVAPTATTAPTIANVTGLSQNLSSLTPSTSYYVWVRSKCSSTEASNWFALPMFNTLCPAVATMFEDFESYAAGSIVPACWDRIIIGSASQTISSATPFSGTKNLYQFSSSTVNQSIVVLPTFSNVNAGTHRLRLRARVTTAPRTIELGYVTNATDASTFVLLESRDITNTTYTAADSEYKFNIPTTVPANGRLAIKNPGGAASVTLYYDDVYWEPAPTCIAPISVMASNITTATATISWDASVSTPANGYDVFYNSTNTAPTATSTPNHANVTALTQNISGLSAATVYYVWVRAVCSTTDQSVWTPLPSFTTPCDPVATMFENFDSYSTGSIVPACWDRIITGAGSQSISSSSPNSGLRNLYQFSSLPANATIVVLPPFSNVNSGTHWLRFKARVTAVPRDIELGYVTNPADASTFVLIETKSITNTTYADPNSEYTFAPPTSVPANARIAIRNPGTLSTALYYDDVYWEVAPTCLAPANVSFTSSTATSADISWTASTTVPALGYEVYYSTVNVAPVASTAPSLTGITLNSVTLTGLTPSTQYYAWIRSKCSAIDSSAWTLRTSFNTQCQPPAILSTNVNPTPVCVGGTATMSATADAGATIKWYDAATGGNLLATNASYTSPVLTATTNYYVTASTGTSGNVGKVNLESNAGTGGSLTTYLTFTALSDFTLNTVDLFPYAAVDGTPGTVTIELRTDTGAPITSTTVNVIGYNSVTTSVAQPVALNFPVIAGQSYRLGVNSWTGITNLYRDATNLAYPYTLPGIVDITGSSLSTTYYYFFYNWGVVSGCESARTMVTAVYDSTCNLGTTDVEDSRNVKVYPNPFTDVLNISEVKNLISVSITDLSGRIVKTIDKPSSQINLGDLQSGMYLVNLKYKDGSVKTVKAIKK